MSEKLGEKLVWMQISVPFQKTISEIIIICGKIAFRDATYHRTPYIANIIDSHILIHFKSNSSSEDVIVVESENSKIKPVLQLIVKTEIIILRNLKQ